MHTLADLDAPWPHRGVSLAVLGHPVRHSISPALHHGALGEMAKTEPRFSDWRYFKFDVPPAELPRALERLHAAGFLGINLTVPHKILALDRVAEIEPAARRAGAINTLKRIERGWAGHNTDGYGLRAGLREELGADLAGARVLLLGAGGAARGAAVECLLRGCAELWIGNRGAEGLQALLAHLGETSGRVRGFLLAEPPPALPEDLLVINATSSGLRPEDPAPFDLARLPAGARVYDMIYNPPETLLLRQARALGLPAANGLSMLVHQGARALEIWSERPVPVAAMTAAARQAMAAKP